MRRDLNKVAGALNCYIFNRLFKEAAEEKNSARDEQARFRSMRNINRSVENAMSTARLLAATTIGGLLGGWRGAVKGGAIGLGTELLGGGIGSAIAQFQGGRDPIEAAEEDKKSPFLNWRLMLLPGYDKYRQVSRRIQAQNSLEDMGRFLSTVKE